MHGWSRYVKVLIFKKNQRQTPLVLPFYILAGSTWKSDQVQYFCNAKLQWSKQIEDDFAVV